MNQKDNRYRITVFDRQAGATRIYEAPVLLEMKNSRKFLGEATVVDLRIDARYVKQVAVKRKAREVTHEQAQAPT